MGSEIEDIVCGVRDYVIAGAGIYIQAIQDAKDDGIMTPDFKLVEMGERDLYSVKTVPACILYPEAAEAEVLSMGKDTISIRINFAIVLHAANQDHALISALRYIDALRQLFAADVSCGSTVDGMGERSAIEYVPVVDDGTYKKIAIFSATFVKDVDR